MIPDYASRSGLWESEKLKRQRVGEEKFKPPSKKTCWPKMLLAVQGIPFILPRTEFASVPFPILPERLFMSCGNMLILQLDNEWRAIRDL
jgi:hypothetical protein